MDIINRIYFAALLNSNDVKIPQNDITTTKLQDILSVIFGLMGGIAVIIIVLAGIKLIMGQGNPEATAKAKNTIIWAAVGLAVSIAAFSIVTFIVDKI